MTDLGTLGGDESEGYGINAFGQVTGEASTAGGQFHAFLYSGSAMTDLGTLPGQSGSMGQGINGSGQVTGWAYGAGDRGFLYSGGTMWDLVDLLDGGNPLNGGWTTLYSGQGINDSGWITGYGELFADGELHAFLMTPVPEPGTLALLGLGLPLGLAWFKRRRAAQ